jgi:hypothetical protein
MILALAWSNSHRTRYQCSSAVSGRDDISWIGILQPNNYRELLQCDYDMRSHLARLKQLVVEGIEEKENLLIALNSYVPVSLPAVHYHH